MHLKRSARLLKLCGGIFFLLTLGACAPHESPRKRFFWPPPTFDQPRIEYLNYFQNNVDVKRGTESALAEAIWGKEKPRPVFNRPQSIASDGRGRIFVSDIEQRRVIIFDLRKREIRPLVFPPFGRRTLAVPGGLDVDAAGEAFVVDSEQKLIFHFGADERLRNEFGAGHLARPTGIVSDAARNRVYVVDTEAHHVVVFTRDGEFVGVIGRRGGANGEFNFPLDADLDGAGNLYVLDAMNARIQVFDSQGTFMRTFGGRGLESGFFQIPKSLAVSPAGHVYVTDSMANWVTVFDLEGNLLLTFGGAVPAERSKLAPGGFFMLQGIDADAQDAIWVVDSLARLFHQFQYLNERYLAEHPIRPGEAAIPEREPQEENRR